MTIYHEPIAKRAFASKKQWRWAFATGQSFARRWAHDTPGAKGARYRALPMKKKTGRSRVKKAAGSFHTSLDL